MTIRAIDIKKKKNFRHEKIPLLDFKVLDVSVMNKKIWVAWIATKQWFAKLFGSEADALLDPYKNNEPPKIGEQPYKDTPLKKWR